MIINQYISETIIPMAIDGINQNNDYQDEEEYDKYIISYLKNVGYLNKVIVENKVRFILLNSLSDKHELINFLNENLL